MIPYLPVVVFCMGSIWGANITASARVTSTQFLTLTLAGHGFAVGDYGYINLSGGGAAPSGWYRVSGTSGNDVTFDLGATYTNPGTADTYWRVGGGNVIGAVTVTAAGTTTTAVGVSAASGLRNVGSLRPFSASSDTAGVISSLTHALGTENKILLLRMT